MKFQGRNELRLCYNYFNALSLFTINQNQIDEKHSAQFSGIQLPGKIIPDHWIGDIIGKLCRKRKS
jgi:hypothetical protein